MRCFAALLVSLLVAWSPPVSAGVLERAMETGSLTVGYREDAAPYSYLNAIGEPAGYTVELCRAVADKIQEDLGLESLTLNYVAVSAEDRFANVITGDIDLLCGATTATLKRRELVDFSIPTFIDGASVLYRTDGPGHLKDMAGRKIGVRVGTTTEKALTKALAAEAIEATIVAVPSHLDGLARLEAGEISAYFADRGILRFLLLKSKDADALLLSNRYFTYEPYALALPRNDTDFRLAVDRALSRLYRGGQVQEIFRATFGPTAQPSSLLKALYSIAAMPE
ncbi:MAG TPA: amino acid ABC transporter substrate-binding protein [Kiloniellaceae bacterium]|nr:amino acid ABC transporter substrate-binding protein [Kiloniellaceae bacterium]